MDTTSPWTVFGSEVLGTGMLLLLGVGVVANVALPTSFGNAGPRHGRQQLGYAWVPVVDPLTGGVLAGALSHVS